MSTKKENLKKEEKIKRFLIEDGIDVRRTNFNYLMYAILIYKPGMKFVDITNTACEHFAIEPKSFRTTITRATKQSKSLANASAKRYIAFVYTKIF